MPSSAMQVLNTNIARAGTDETFFGDLFEIIMQPRS